eukprot:5303246-Pyramimonas_sp.AAC.1
MADDPPTLAQVNESSGGSKQKNHSTKDSNRPAFKVKAVKVPPSQQRLEVRSLTIPILRDGIGIEPEHVLVSIVSQLKMSSF